MLQTQWMQWIWLAGTLAALALVGYGLMKFFRYGLRQMAKRMVTEGILDETMLRWVEDIAKVLRMAVILVVAILGVFFALRAIGHPVALGWSPASIVNWLVEHGVPIVLLVVGAYLAIKVSHMLLYCNLISSNRARQGRIIDLQEA